MSEVYIDQVYAMQAGGVTSYIMPVSACIAYNSKKRLSQWYFGNVDVAEITEDMWIAWFRRALVVHPDELDIIMTRLRRAITFDMRIRNADSRMSRMLGNLSRALDQDHQE